MAPRRALVLACALFALLTATATASSSAVPFGLPTDWTIPSVDGLPVAPPLPVLPAPPNRVRMGLPGPDSMLATGSGSELHGLEGSDRLRGGPGPDRLFGDTGGDRLPALRGGGPLGGGPRGGHPVGRGGAR